MTLLKLPPESERLRRIARAYAAGEVGVEEYRRIRAQVIEAFAAGTAHDWGEDTEQRIANARDAHAAPPPTSLDGTLIVERGAWNDHARPRWYVPICLIAAGSALAGAVLILL